MYAGCQERSVWRKLPCLQLRLEKIILQVPGAVVGAVLCSACGQGQRSHLSAWPCKTLLRNELFGLIY